MATDLNRVTYAGNDFATNMDEIVARLQVKFASSYNDFSASSLGIVLLDAIAFAMDTLGFQLDRRATDNYLTTARTRASVAKLSRQLGHKMAPAVASSVDISVTPQGLSPFQVTMPLGFQFAGPSGLIFEARGSLTWDANEVGGPSTQIVTCSEGETKTATFVSTGQPNQVFTIRNVPKGKFVVGPGSDGVSQLSVVVNGETWTEEEFLLYESTNHFEMSYNDSPPQIRFGDGLSGNIPEAGASIFVTYFASTGVAGKATSGSISKGVKSLVVNFTTIPLTINNVSGTSGGSDPESIVKAKAFAPRLFKARGVNVTSEDYEARATTFVDSVYGAIAVAQAVAVRSAASDIYLQERLTTINGLAGSIEEIVALASENVSIGNNGVITTLTALDELASESESKLTELGETAEDLTELHATAKISSTIINSESTDINALATTLLTTVNATTLSSTSNVLTSAVKTEMLALLERIKAQSSDIMSRAGEITNNVGSTALGQLESIKSLAVTSLDFATKAQTDIATMTTAVAATTAIVATLDDTIDAVEDGVMVATEEVNAHVGSFLSSDCQSNLIEVPVLTLDPDGFYVLPTIGLVRSLQRYLEKKKEVTQVVKVVAASNILVAASLLVRLGVKKGYAESTVRSRVEAILLSVLKGRKFGVTLFLSDLYDPVSLADIDGLSYINVKITDPVALLDTDGNLLVEDYQVITRGTLTFTTEIETGT